ncbi:hypothetical protein NPIL_103441 [Nephila pilipes]|uniref:Uncharacterized protein n=1 Tax=Nephila pilipes TaxID=299642 RepID=A0A8X6MBZ9_NEPPI|nr:hypothetical protein NPIL_103441 [Nephila pilipes]
MRRTLFSQVITGLFLKNYEMTCERIQGKQIESTQGATGNKTSYFKMFDTLEGYIGPPDSRMVEKKES